MTNDMQTQDALGNAAQSVSALPIIVVSRRLGRAVLANKAGDMAALYTNRKQANAACDRVKSQGHNAWVTARWPFLVVVEGLEAAR